MKTLEEITIGTKGYRKDSKLYSGIGNALIEVKTPKGSEIFGMISLSIPMDMYNDKGLSDAIFKAMAERLDELVKMLSPITENEKEVINNEE